jgi:hypothetical protein
MAAEIIISPEMKPANIRIAAESIGRRPAGSLLRFRRRTRGSPHQSICNDANGESKAEKLENPGSVKELMADTYRGA